MGISKPGVIAGLLAVVLAGDVAGVLHVKGEQREAAAAERRAADAAWIADVRAIAQDLVQARAPIADAGRLPGGDDLADGVRYDVYVRGAAAADLAAVRDRLSAVRPPGPRAQAHQRLLDTLGEMHDAVVGLADLDDDVIEDELIAFAHAAAAWEHVVKQDVADDLPPATTSGVQEGLTRAGQVFRWSNVCATATRDMEALPEEPEDPAQIADAMTTEAAVLDRLLADLLAVVPAEVDAPDVTRDLEPALSGMRETVTVLETLSEAVRRLDVDAAEEGFVLLDRLSPLLENASRFFEGHGSTMCSSFFDVGVVPVEAPPEDDLATT